MPESAPVLWVYRRGRQRSYPRWQADLEPSEFFYGLITLRSRYHVAFVEDPGATWFWRLWYPFERVIARWMEMGFALHLALHHLGTLRKANVVISTVDACGLPLALLKTLRLFSGKLIYISQGLTDRAATLGRDHPLCRFYRRILESADRFATLSPGASRALETWLGLPTGSVASIPFGVDCDFWRPMPASGGQDGVLSIGSDSGRDYDTLLQAAQDVPLHLVTRQHVARTSNVTVTTVHSQAELRELYAGSRFVVIPLKDRDQPSGQSTALQAMACGKAVIMTKTRGFWGDGVLNSEQNCLLVAPGDMDGLRTAITRLWADAGLCARLGQNARDTVVSCFSETSMAEAVSALIEQVSSETSMSEAHSR